MSWFLDMSLSPLRRSRVVISVKAGPSLPLS